MLLVLNGTSTKYVLLQNVTGTKWFRTLNENA